MSRIFLILMLLLPFTGHTQNYQCLQSGVKHYFTNKGGYLRGIRIDSTNTYPDSIVYYPYHTPRGRYSINPILDSTGGSWLGKRVLQLNDGTFLFDNLWNDTVVIKTQANPGDTWVFYNDTTNLYYQADVLSTDTMTVLGSVDSVKRILITAHNPSGIVTTDFADSFQIWISKNNGFVQTFDLYTFPYHVPDSAHAGGLDYYSDHVGAQQFSLTDLINPPIQDLYHWAVGDIFEFSSCNGLFDHYGYGCNPVEYYEMDTVIDINIVSGQKMFSLHGWRDKYSYPEVSSHDYPPFPNFYSQKSVDTTLGCATDLVFDLNRMPEEYLQSNIYTYLPDDTSYCLKKTLYGIQYNSGLQGIQTGFWAFESGISPTIYKASLGLVSDAQGQVSIDGYVMYADNLIYSNRGGVICGATKYPALNIRGISANGNSIELYPNPVTDALTISSTSKIANVDIINLLGQSLFSKEYNSREVKIDVSSLPDGVYFVRINNSEMKKFTKQ